MTENQPSSPERPALSVLIPTYGRGPQLGNLLSALAQQTLAPERFEVIVIDDGTPEPIEIEASEFEFRIQLERQPNGGPASARNRGLELCTAPLVLILNDDAVPARNLLAVHLAAHEEAPVPCAVLGTFRFTEEARRHAFVRILDESDLLFQFSGLQHNHLHPWQFFWTCNLSLSVEAVREVGGFDEELFDQAIVEDVELGYRLEQRGLQVLYREDAVCHHDHVLTPESYLRRGVRLGVYLTRMYQKHGDPQLLYFSTHDAVHELMQGCPDVVAHYQTVLENLARGLERVEEEYFDRALPEKLQADTIALLRELSGVTLRRGIHLENTGVDLIELAETGPPVGGLTSIIVVSFNALRKTRRCLERILATREAEFPIELLVVDNGSTDGSAEWLAQQPEVRLIRNEANLGAPHARNQAIAVAGGDWLAFFDNDVYVTEGWLSRALYHAAADPGLGAIGLVSNRAAKLQQVPYEGDSSQDSIERYAARCASEWARRGQDALMFTSFGVLVRGDVVQQLGGFDTVFSPWGFEDDDYSLRIHLAGYRSRVARDVFVYHDHYHDPAKEARHSALLRRNWEQFAKKWGTGKVPPMYDYDGLQLNIEEKRPADELFVALDKPVAEFASLLETKAAPAARVASRADSASASTENARRNVLILGSGRSGTSMLSGTLYSAGWDVGDEPYEGRDANPKGFFETAEINGINEYLLANALPASSRMGRMQRWLAEASGELEFELPAELERRMRRLAERKPFAFKDPRFCYTLPAWRPHLGAFGVVCVFREPAVTAASILKECAQEPYLAGLDLDFEAAVRIWTAMYRQVLERHRKQGDWLFLHYDQLLTEDGLQRLERFVGGPVGRDFPDANLRRSRSTQSVSSESAEIYRKLCTLAEFDSTPIEVVDEAKPPSRFEGEPELTVLVCTYQRRETLARCLDSFCAQTALRGSFELVVVNDGSTDGTREYLDQREFEIPARVVHRENGGLSAARNSGLEVTRGRFVLLVNDDTIATPGLVEAHLRAHRRLQYRKVAVQGTFEQPAEALDNALMRTLEDSDMVFCYSQMKPGQLYDWNRFWTCNVSVATEAVRGVGAFDEEFRHYGCEDTDLALRLDAAGYSVYYEAEARAEHEHLLSFEDLARRNRTVSRAWVRLFRKHPRALQHADWAWVSQRTLADYERVLEGVLPDLPALEAAAREMSQWNLGALENSGTQGARSAKGLQSNLEQMLRKMSQLWWCEGLAEGLREFGLESFQPLLDSLQPWPLGTAAERCVLAWPRYDTDEDLEVLANNYAEALLADEELCLCLRYDPANDGALEDAIERITRTLGNLKQEDGRGLDVLIVDDALEAHEVSRLGGAVNGVLNLAGTADPARVRFLQDLQTAVVADLQDLERLLGTRDIAGSAAEERVPTGQL